MSGVAKAVGAIAGVVAIVAKFIPGGQVVSTVATVVAAVANVVAVATAHPSHPPAQGSATRVTIGANQPMPYAMGRTYIAGAQVHDAGYGGTVSGVPNPYSSTVFVYSLGPVEAIEAFQADFTTITFSGGNATGYYAGFMSLATQLGACPESAALAGPHGAIPGWGASYKLSGLCASLWTCNFDKKGKVFASGFPQPGVILNLANAVYDPRQDSTYPGGSGACRALDETTYVWGAAGENPACHGVTYALGRFQNSEKVFGPAFPVDSIDWPAWVAFANVCDANAWKIGGLIWEGPGISRWDNLKRICAAGAAEPCFVGGLLSVRYSAPKTSLDTIVAADLADGEPQIAGMKTWRTRLNSIVPKYRSEDHQWEYVQSDAVTSSTYVTEDGEEKSEERQYDLCQDKDQAAQLAAYDLVNGRELGPFVLPLKPRLLPYLIGEALTVDIPEMGLSSQLCTITGRKFDPGKAIVTLTLETETTAKHAFALGKTGTAPPTPSLVTGADIDAVLNATTGNLQVSALPPAVTVPCSDSGTPIGAVPGFSIAVFKSDTDVTADCTYAVLGSSNVSGATHSGGGVFTVSGMTDDTGYVDVTVDNGATTIVRVPYAKVKAGSAASAAVPTHITSMNDTGSYVVIATLPDIAVPDGATLSADASAIFDVSGGYTCQVKLTYENITDSGAETDFPSSENSVSCTLAGNPWSFSTNGTWSNALGATKVVRVRLYQRQSVGSHATSGVDGYLNGST